MHQIYFGLTAQELDAAQHYAASHGLAFEIGHDQDDEFYFRPLPGDDDSPMWTGEAIDRLEAVLAS